MGARSGDRYEGKMINVGKDHHPATPPNIVTPLLGPVHLLTSR